MDPRPALPSDSLVVLYDGECNLCQFGVSQLRRLDPRHKLFLVPFQDTAQVRALGLNHLVSRAAQELLVITPSWKVQGGFFAVRLLARKLWRMWHLLPLLYSPLAPWLGPRIYRWVAEHRHTLLGDVVTRGATVTGRSSPD